MPPSRPPALDPKSPARIAWARTPSGRTRGAAFDTKRPERRCISIIRGKKAETDPRVCARERGRDDSLRWTFSMKSAYAYASQAGRRDQVQRRGGGLSAPLGMRADSGNGKKKNAARAAARMGTSRCVTAGLRLRSPFPSQRHHPKVFQRREGPALAVGGHDRANVLNSNLRAQSPHYTIETTSIHPSNHLRTLVGLPS